MSVQELRELLERIEDTHEIVLRTSEPTRVLNELTAEALAEGHELDGLVVRRPTLEDVYLLLTAEGAAEE